MTTLNGRHVDVDEFACRTCGEMGAEKRCSACKQVFYCNAVCQKMHWFTHKKPKAMSRPRPQGLGILAHRLNLTQANGSSEFQIDGIKYETKEADIRNVNGDSVMLGSGQYGDVFLKRHMQSNILLAEKVIRKREDPKCKGVLSYIDTEKELWTKCHHPLSSACYLGHVTGYQPIRDLYFLIRSVPADYLPSQFHQIGREDSGEE
eukprot:sb/3470484/